MSKQEAIKAIQDLAQSQDELESLAGEMLATLKINLERGHLRFRNDANDSEVFRKMLTQWEITLRRCQEWYSTKGGES